MTETVCLLIGCVILFVLGWAAGAKFGEWSRDSAMKKKKTYDIEADEHAKDWDRLSGRL